MSVDDDSLTNADSRQVTSPQLEDATTEGATSMARVRRRPTPVGLGKDLRAVDEHYKLLEPLGRGGMGEVIAAHDEILGRSVALKRMLRDDADGIATARFVREARIQARLDHPAIPPVHELARDRSGRPYFVMKRLVGTPLSEVLKRSAARDPEIVVRFPRQRLLRAFADVCLAVEFAHSRGVIHRDLKPANIMLGDYGETYVIDWGIAKVIGDTDPALAALRDSADADGDATRAGTMIGTPAYMAPEQRMAAQDLDGRADVDSLGRILADIFAGNSIAPELDEACAAATAVDRTQRTQSAREPGERVQRYLDGDRDLALRTALAVEHLEAARTALAAGDDARATREAGRALALDPKQSGAAELITLLMLQPPKEIPPDVTARLADEDDEATKRHAWIAVLVYVGLLLFIPYFLMMGVTEPRYLVALTITIGVLLVNALVTARLGAHPVRRFLVIAGIAVWIALIARMLTPFTIAPGIAAVSTMVLIAIPMFAGRRTALAIALAFSLACLVPFALESAGVISETMTFTGDTIVLESPALAFPVAPTIVGLILFAVGFVVATSQLARHQARVTDDARMRVHLQAWRLRQLV